MARSQPQIPEYADIGYEYNERKHNERTAARLRAGGLATDVPTGWPKLLKGPLAWTSSDYPSDSLYVYTLSDSNRAEIMRALEHFKGRLFVLFLSWETYQE